MARAIRKLRHWRQQFEPNAAFIWRRPGLWADWRPPSVVEGRATIAPGEIIPPELAENRRKLETLWEAGRIELAEFDEPPRIGIDGSDLNASDDSGGPETPSASPGSAQSPAGAVQPPARDGAAGGEPTGDDADPPPADGAKDGQADPPTDSQQSATDTGTSDADPPLVDPELLPAGATVRRRGVAWFIVTLADGTEHKANGKTKLEELLTTLRAGESDADA